MRLLPVGFTVFLISFPAGLFVYWITSNLVTLVQNYAIYNYGPGKRPAAEAKSPAGKTSNAAAPKVSSNGSNSSNTAESHGDAAAHAAKVAKRKRRKKKK
jgi:YidC/Oxa1 family membrane protein insertase